MNNDSLPRSLIILFLISFPLTLLAQSSDFVEQIELPPLVLAEQYPDDFTNDDPSKDSAQSLLSQTTQKSGFMQVNERTGIGIIPRGVLGIMSYEYKENYPSGQDIKWSDNIPYAGVGITLDYNNFALDIYAQQTVSGKDSFFNTQPAPGVIIFDDNTNLSRRDLASNVSYGIQNLLTNKGDALIFSVGYKWGQSDINGARRRTVFPENQPQYTIYDTEETQFTTGGPSIGVTYGFPIGQKSKIGINIAFTKLVNTDFRKTGPTQFDIDTTQGLTVGAIWMGSITNEISYSLSFDYYKYEMTGTTWSLREVNTDPFTLEEQVMSLKASISYAPDL
jgi:hypothetical protein